MALPGIVAQPFLQLLKTLRFRLTFGEQSPMNILGTHQPGTANYNPIAIFLPYQSGSGTDAQSLSNLRRNRDLPL
jgi:hypothetical protein